MYQDMESDPQLQPIDSLTPENLVSIDEAHKTVSGKSPERIMHEANISFIGCFGTTPEMQAVIRLTGGKIEPTVDDYKLDNLLLEMAEERLNIKRESPHLSPLELSHGVLKTALEKHFPDITLPEIEFLNQFTYDQILDVGSPYRKLAELFGYRVTTIDYEFKENEENKNVRRRLSAGGETLSLNSIAHIARKCAQKEHTPEALKQLLDSGSNPTGSIENRPRGLAQVLDDVYETGTVFIEGKTPTREAAAEMQEKIAELRNIQAQIALLHPTGNKKSPFKDNRSVEPDNSVSDEEIFLEEDLGILMREIFYINRGKERLETFAVFEEEVLPRVIYENIEDIMDALFSGSQNELPYQVRNALRNALSNLGKDPDSYDPLEPGADPFDLLQEIVKQKGFEPFAEVNPQLADKLQKEATELMDGYNPAPTEVDGGPVHKMIFPFTQELPAKIYQRIMMSWSLSTKGLPAMTNEQIQNQVWPELDRLLANDGIAIIFPIGHYANDQIAGRNNQTPEERLHETLVAFTEAKGKRFNWEFTDSQDPQLEGASVLVISRTNVFNDEHNKGPKWLSSNK
jgi:hypothetical protein